MRVALLLALMVVVVVVAPVVLHAAPEDFSKPQSVVLKTGKKVFGHILQSECTNDILVIRELRTKSKREIKWADIKADKAQSLRVALGFEVPEEKGGKRIKGHEIIMKNGHTVIGVLMNADTVQRDGMYIIKRADGVRRVRITDVREGPNEVEIDALEVYTPLELYQQKLKANPPKTAEDHFRLAEFAAAMGALPQAKLHYEKVLEIGDRKYPEPLIKRRLERVAKRMANSDAEAAIREIKQLTWHKRFAKASQLVVAFLEKYKDDADLFKEGERLKADLSKRRQAHYIAQVPRMVRETVKSLFAAKVKESELTLRMASNYAGGESSDENSATHAALIAIGAKLGIDPGEVLDFWKLRNRRPMHKAFYRDGTFIVIDNLQDALAKAPKIPSGKGKSAIKPPKPHPVKTPDGWWNGKLKARKFTQARDWLYAWWAEKSGMVDLLEPKTEGCQTCAGRGYTMSMHNTSQGAIPVYDRCQVCHMARKFRVVRFK